jgi:hypothetical protein
MRAPTEQQEGASFQALFHRRWNHLNDPHVRTLAWLLDAPDLLDPLAERWQGRVVSLGEVGPAIRGWLTALDHAPASLHAHLGLQPFTRLGRYAEKLLAFYLAHLGVLFAHGVQVRSEHGATVGEFDFLLKQGEALVHWEFATKLYLLESSGHGRHADYFVGPNLADTLGVKVRKIMDQQLSLSQHPAARMQLQYPVHAAQALVKGWLFYRECTPAYPQGVAAAHCRGFWRPLSETGTLAADAFLILPRLEWLAPAKAAVDASSLLWPAELGAELARRFAASSAPVLVALMKRSDDRLLEFDRGFIVPDDWHQRAAVRIRGVA